MVVGKGVKKARTLNQAINKQKQMTSGEPARVAPARLQAATFHGAVAPEAMASPRPPVPAPAPARARSASPPARSLKTQTTLGKAPTVTFSSDKPNNNRATGNPQHQRTAPALTNRRGPMSPEEYKARTSPANVSYDYTPTTASPASPTTKPRTLDSDLALAQQGRSPSPSWQRQRTSPAHTNRRGPVSPEEYKARTSPATMSPEKQSRAAGFKAGSSASLNKLGRTKTLDSMSPDKDAPQTALAGQNAYFGTGECMEAVKWNKWSRMVDRQTYGAHYEYIVGDLSAGHWAPDPEQQAHDELLADGLHKRRPSETPHPRASSPRNPMRTAFTDRSSRMREGRGARTALMTQQDVPTEWGEHGECLCEVCKPFETKPAGNASHNFHYNKVPRCNKDSVPTQPHWENELTHTFNSAKVVTAMEHVVEQGPTTPPAQEERAFVQNMGRKIKSPRPHSPGGGRMLEYCSMNEDPPTPAGQFNQDRPSEIMMHDAKGRQAWQGRRGQSPSRSGVALVLDAQGVDPPPPERIVAARRADGEFKSGNTKQAEGLTTYFNQDVFRYSQPGIVRGRSASPPKFDNAAGTGTGQWVLSPRAKDCPSSPRKEYRSMMCNNSRTMANVMSYDAGEQCFAQEAAARKQNDSAFVELCHLTAESRGETMNLADCFKQHRGHASYGAGDQMVWNEH